MRLILARHGRTALNRDGRIQGVNDDPLDSLGRAQAGSLATTMKRERPAVLYSSPIARAAETAAAISAALGLPVVAEPDLAEIDVGLLVGLTGREMRERYPDFISLWSRDAGATQTPGGESMAQLQDRAWRAAGRLASRHPDETVLAVTHNFTVVSLVCKVLGLPLRRYRQVQPSLGSISRLEFTAGLWVLTTLNETAHLRHLGEGADGSSIHG